MLYGDEEIEKTPFDMGFDQNKDNINTKEGYIKFLILKLIGDGIKHLKKLINASNNIKPYNKM